MDADMERNMKSWKVPQSDIDELKAVEEFLRAWKEYKKAKDEGRLTEEMKREFLQMMEDLSK